MIKLDRSRWARKLRNLSFNRAIAKRRRRSQEVTESLEDRCLLTPFINDFTDTFPENLPNGSVIVDLNDANTDSDFDNDGDALTYSILSGNSLGGFAINAFTGVITVADQEVLDFETNDKFNLLIEADDGNGERDTATITVCLDNLDENLRIDSIGLIDGNGTPIVTTMVGEMIGIETLYRSANLPDPIDYRIEYLVNGVPLSNEGLDNGAGGIGEEQWTDMMEGWYAEGGIHTVTVTLDADDTVAEDDETDNTLTFTFVAATASPPVRFSWPLDGTPQQEYYITGYVDTDPTTDDNTRDDEQDYAGGFHTYDETTGWHISPTTFQEQDLKIPVYAAADGVVSAINDGVFDREIAVLDPLPDPIPEENFITIDHGDGYSTTYSRLRQNSVWLRPGDPVVEGQLIGMVGSSGPFAFEPALHFEVSRFGRPIETLRDPNVYLNDIPVYSGSFSQIRRSFFTQCLPTHPFPPCPNPTTFEESIPYDFRPHMLEGPSNVDYFTVTGDQPITVFVEFGTIRTGDLIEAVWLRPDGTEYARDQEFATREDYSAEFWWRQFMPPEPIQGVWTVEFFQNGAKFGEDTFSVQFEEFADLRVERQSIFFPARLDGPLLGLPEDLYVDERYTPVDLDMPGGGALGLINPAETWSLHNQGTAPLIIDNILVPAEFQLGIFDKGGAPEAFPMMVQPGTASYLTVQPQPGLPPGYYSGMVRIFTNDPEEQDYNISIESRVPGGAFGELEVAIAARDIFEDPVTSDLRTRLVANVRRINADLTDELVVDLVAEVSDVLFPGNVRIPAGDDYASFYIETFNDDKIEGTEILRVGAVDRNPTNTLLPAFTTVRIVDDDFAGVNVVATDGDTVVDENGSTDTFDVTLTAEPITNVVLNVSSDDIGETSAGPTTLTFTPLNWNVPQTVTVTGVNDDETDGDIDSNIVISVVDFLSDNDFDNLTDTLVPVTTIDNDVPNFLITESDGFTVVSEGGLTDQFAVRLTRQPQFNVFFDITVGDPSEATVDLASLVFTPTNWDTDQIVTVSGIDDAFVDGTISSSITASIQDVLSDPDWALVADQSISVATNDDEVAGFVITETDGSTSVNESGTSDTFEVALSDLPLTDVRLRFVVDDPSEYSVSPSTVRFTKTNGTTPQVITVQGIDDTQTDGNVVSALTIEVIDNQSNNFFDPLPPQFVTVTTVDNDVADVTVIQSDGTTVVTEDGLTDSVQLSLSSQPTSNVVLNLASSDTDQFDISDTTLTFTPTNWDTPRTVTITADDDILVDGDVTEFININVDPGSDPTYAALPDKQVNVAVIDNEIAEIVVDTLGPLEVSEDGTTATFNVSLTGEPLSNVVVALLRSDDSEVELDVSQITFNSTNYNVPQLVTITGLDDEFVDGTIPSAVTLRVVDLSSHSAYHPAADKIVSVSTLDNEVAGIATTESDGSTQVEETGTTDTVMVALTGEPRNDVVLNVSIDDASEASFEPAVLTFTSGNWETPQPVTVTGLDDLLADGDIISVLRFAVDVPLSDSQYATVPDALVNVTTVDDEAPTFTITESNGETLAREGGNTDSVEVVLDSSPLNPVTISVSSQDPAEMSLGPATLTFDSSNWNTPQTVTFTAVDDTAQDGKNFTVADFVVAAGSDSMFLGQSDTVIVATVDNDAPVFLDATDLVVEGTPNADIITLSELAGQVTVDLNGGLWQFDVADYDRVFIDALSGDDNIDLSATSQPTLVKGGGGNDTVLGSQGENVIRGGGGNDRIFGGDLDDSLNGGSGRDSIEGADGNDTLHGSRSHDTLLAGPGDDLMAGHAGRDVLMGGEGNDSIGGNAGGDLIMGEAGDDSLIGGTGNDTVFGGTGSDTVTAGSGQDKLYGEAGGDLIIGGADNDTVEGGDGRDVLFGGTQVDVINGGNGEDILVSGRSALSVSKLATVLAEWNSSRTYQQRVDNIHDGPAKTPDRLNTRFMLGPNRPSGNQNTFDDGSTDYMSGEAETDFFFANVGLRDRLLDNTLSEWVDLI